MKPDCVVDVGANDVAELPEVPVIRDSTLRPLEVDSVLVRAG